MRCFQRYFASIMTATLTLWLFALWLGIEWLMPTTPANTVLADRLCAIDLACLAMAHVFFALEDSCSYSTDSKTNT